MRLITPILTVLIVITSCVQAKEENTVSKPQLNRAAIQTVAPALDQFTQGPLLGEVWKRPGLNMRDRTLITIAALIARNQTIEMPFYFNLALDNGLKPSELSETITHLAFYSGWPNAMAAVAVATEVFAARSISHDQLPQASPALLALDEKAEAQRAAGMSSNLVPSRRASSSTRRNFCSETCGFALVSHPVTAAS